MIAGALKEVISVEQPKIVKDDFGANKLIWETAIASTRAKVTYTSGNRANENNEIVFAYNVIFTVRIYHQISENMRIIWKSKKYRILSLESDLSKQQLTINTELINE